MSVYSPIASLHGQCYFGLKQLSAWDQLQLNNIVMSYPNPGQVGTMSIKSECNNYENGTI